jgi:hypothetical protein
MFNEDYVLEPKIDVTASSSHAVGATDHIMRKLDKLTMHDWYHGTDQVGMVNGACMYINHI